MPRLFQSRARPPREKARAQFPQYETYGEPYGDYDYGYQGQSGYEQEPHHSSGWRRVLTKKPKANGRTYQPEYDDPRRDKSYRVNVEESPEEYEEDLNSKTLSEDTESFVEITPRNRSSVPVVQRESSLSRLQEAFTDHGMYGPATSQATSAVQDTPRYSPMQLDTARPFQMATVHEARQAPVLVNSPPREGIRADIEHASSRHEHRSGSSTQRDLDTQSHYPGSSPYEDPGPSRRRDPYQSDYTRNAAYEGSGPGKQRDVYSDYSRNSPHNAPAPQADYPPVTVVVEHGKHGQKDTYYVIPGGAPVVFEDEDGNEITRVGDFSGNYKPQPVRPVIVEDQYGREICRAGFDNKRQSSKNGSDEDLYYDDQRGAPSRKQRNLTSSSSRRYVDDYADENDYYPPRNTVRNAPNVVYIDPFSKQKEWSSPPASITSSSRSTSRRHKEDRHFESARRYEQSPNVIHLNPRGERKSNASRSNDSSGSQSYRGRDRSYR